MFGREAKHLDNLVNLVHLVRAGKEGLASVHLDEDATQAPHVDREVVSDPEENLGTAVEPALDVLVDSLSYLARRPKVNYLDSAPLWVAQQNVFWLQITVDDFQLRGREKEEGCGDLLSKFPSQVEGDSPEVGVPEQVVEVVGEQLEDQAEVVAPHKVVLQLDHVVLVLGIRPVHHLEQLVFYLSLLQEWFLVLDDLDRNLTLFNLIVSLDYLTEGTFADQTINFIPEIRKNMCEQSPNLEVTQTHLSANFSPCLMM